MRNHTADQPRSIPTAVKTAQTSFVAVLVPVYWRQYGPGNFLWFSDVALLTSVPALWLESRLLGSMQAIAVIIPEGLWLVDFSVLLARGRSPIGLAEYMFDDRIPRGTRALSLFHLWLSPLFVYLVARKGYDRRALKWQSVATWLLLLASWRLTKPSENVNWVYAFRDRIRSRAGRAAAVAGLMALWPVVFHLPAHAALKRLFPEPACHPTRAA